MPRKECENYSVRSCRRNSSLFPAQGHHALERHLVYTIPHCHVKGGRKAFSGVSANRAKAARTRLVKNKPHKSLDRSRRGAPLPIREERDKQDKRDKRDKRDNHCRFHVPDATKRVPPLRLLSHAEERTGGTGFVPSEWRLPNVECRTARGDTRPPVRGACFPRVYTIRGGIRLFFHYSILFFPFFGV